MSRMVQIVRRNAAEVTQRAIRRLVARVTPLSVVLTGIYTLTSGFVREAVAAILIIASVLLKKEMKRACTLGSLPGSAVMAT